ncbi:PPE domain-containing protein [Streptomyces marokkonensis]|uniref:PPE domain-containing protein n=1 Tax=Streptomyces marokkonensis TaxID=324855 RepID=A0ABP7PM71_9ACTN
MLTYEDIIDAPVAKLKAAADDWSKMAGKLDELATDAADGMKAKAGKAAWEGVNAGVTKAFVGKTVKEFTDAAAEAEGVKRILEEGYAAIKKAKDDLVNIRDHEGPAAGIRVDGKGKVSARKPLSEIPAARHDPDYSDLLQEEKKNIESWQKRIDLIVDNCNDTDVALKNTLEANVTDRKDFGAPTYTKLDQEEAARAAALAARGGDLTHKELQQLNELLKDNGSSKEFAKNFYEKLGPEKSLAFFGQLAMDTQEYGKVDSERLKDVQELQKNLGLNLATASHDKEFTDKWGPELRKLGAEHIALSKHDAGGPFGYQLLGGIMRYGNYDAKFLNPIAEHVAQLHQKDPGLFAETKMVNSWLKNPYNPSGVNGAGYDPATAMLEALGNSPEAAKKFFADPPTAYNEDGTVNHDATADLGKDKGGEVIDNYLDFFTHEKWESFADVNSLDPKELEASLDHMPDALGHALEAATLGYPAGHPDAGVVRDEDNAAVMQKVMEKYADDPGLLKERHEAMADSLGVMGAGYIDDINWALAKNDPNSVFAPGRNPDGHLDFADTVDGNGRSVVRGFLSTLGQHPDAYATVSTAEQVYTRSALEGAVGPDGRITEEVEARARATVRVGAEVQGMLDQSRADQVEATNLKTHEDYEKAVAERAGWVEFGAAAGIAAGVAFLPATAAVGAAAVLVPLATDTAGGAAEQFIGQMVGDISGQSVDEHKEKVEELSDEERLAVFSAGEVLAEAPMEEFLQRHVPDPRNSTFAQDLRESMLIGYGVGNDRENQQGNRPETG